MTGYNRLQQLQTSSRHNYIKASWMEENRKFEIGNTFLKHVCHKDPLEALLKAGTSIDKDQPEREIHISPLDR